MARGMTGHGVSSDVSSELMLWPESLLQKEFPQAAAATDAPSVSGGSRWRLLRGVVSLPVLFAFGVSTLPARALPGASVEVIRLDRRGVRAMPGISAALERGGQQTAQATPTESPAGAATGATEVAAAAPTAPAADEPRDKTVLSDSSASIRSGLSQTFDAPLPADLAGTIRLVLLRKDGTPGDLFEDIAVPSSQVTISDDRLQLTVRTTKPIKPGESVLMQLPSTSPEGLTYTYPNYLASTPCVFTVPAGAVAGAAVAGAGAAAGVVGAAATAAGISIPVLAIVGAVVVGVGVAAAAGAFNGGGGGTGRSSQ